MGNPVIAVSSTIFSDSIISYVASGNFRICCVKYTAYCHIQPQWPGSCKRLLTNVVLRSFIWTISILALLSNISSCCITRLSMLDNAASYNIVITCLAFSDIAYSISVLIITAADEIFANDYLESEYNWRQNSFCHISLVLQTNAYLLSLFITNLIALTRYFVISHPFDSRFLEKRYLVKICFLASLVVMLLSSALILPHILFMAENHQLPTTMCTLIGHTQESFISLVITSIIMAGQGASCYTIPVTYYFLHRKLEESTTEVGKVRGKNSAELLSTSRLVSILSPICWASSAILLFITFVWKDYPYVILVFTCMILIPLNSIINSVVFVFLKLIKVCLKCLKVTC